MTNCDYWCWVSHKYRVLSHILATYAPAPLQHHHNHSTASVSYHLSSTAAIRSVMSPRLRCSPPQPIPQALTSVVLVRSHPYHSSPSTSLAAFCPLTSAKTARPAQWPIAHPFGRQLPTWPCFWQALFEKHSQLLFSQVSYPTFAASECTSLSGVDADKAPG